MVEILHSVDEPITLAQGLNVIVALEYAPGKLIFGLDEPGYLLAIKSNPVKAKVSAGSNGSGTKF